MSRNSSHLQTPAPTAPPRDNAQRWSTLKQDLHRRLIQAVDHAALRRMDESQIRHQLRLGAEELCRSRPDLLNSSERARLIDELVDETLGLGPLEQLLRDPTVSDILINGPQMLYIERDGCLERTSLSFHSDAHLLSIVQKIVARVGRRIDESSPMVDARLPDGSRVNAIIPPLALDGTLVSIRRFRADAVRAEHLLTNHSMNQEMFDFLQCCIAGKANIIISGGTGSGKTTLLNVLSEFIPENERVVTIEDAAELRLNQPHVARLESRPPNIEGMGEITARDLLRNALRMRPDRIIVGECRGSEAFDMLQAMNTGHDGSLTTIHANNTRDAISRLEMLVEMAGFSLSPTQVDRLVAAALDILVHVERLPDGRRKITQISELTRDSRGESIITDLYTYDEQAAADGAEPAKCFRRHPVTPSILKTLAARQAPSRKTREHTAAASHPRVATPGAAVARRVTPATTRTLPPPLSR